MRDRYDELTRQLYIIQSFRLKIDLTICSALGMNPHVQCFCRWAPSARRKCFAHFLNPTVVNWLLNENPDLRWSPCVQYLHAARCTCLSASEQEMERDVRKWMMPWYRRGWDEEKWGRGQLFTWPLSSLHIYCLLSFFKANLFLDISKTHLKAILALWLQPSPSASSSCTSFNPPPPRPTLLWHLMCRSAQFFGSQHSFDSIPRAICNPLQDTEPPSHRRHLSIALVSVFLSSAPLPFFFLLHYRQPQFFRL